MAAVFSFALSGEFVSKTRSAASAFFYLWFIFEILNSSAHVCDCVVRGISISEIMWEGALLVVSFAECLHYIGERTHGVGKT